MPESEDEVAELAQTLDEMLRELDAARSETQQMIQAQRDFVAIFQEPAFLAVRQAEWFRAAPCQFQQAAPCVA